MSGPAKVKKCPKCAGLCLLWTGVCLRCGRVDAAALASALVPARLEAPRGQGGVGGQGGAAGQPRVHAGESKPDPDPVEVEYASSADWKEEARSAPVAIATPAAPASLAPVAGANHYLILGWRDAVELVPGRRFLIGRGAGVNLRVPHMDVSRQHAAIEWDGGRPILRDLSGKLTLVNEQPAEGDGAILRDGDTLRLGPSFSVSYRNVTERQLTYDVFGTDKRPDGSPTIATAPENGGALVLPVAAPAPPPAPIPNAVDGAEPTPEPALTDVAPGSDEENVDFPLEGDFTITSAAEVLASIFRLKLTGGLIISKAPGTGALRIEKGRVKGVVFRMRTGQEAAEEVKTLTQGSYRFVKE